MRKLLVVSLGALLWGLASGQTLESALELADVHPAPPTAKSLSMSLPRGAGRFEIRSATMLDLIDTAYKTEPAEVVGGPNWLDKDRFDVIAKIPSAGALDAIRPTLQKLLADRFKLKARTETQQVAVYALTLGKGKPKLRQTVPGPDKEGCRAQPITDPIAPGGVRPQLMKCHNVTMETFLQTLRAVGFGYFSGNVVDLTGLKGNWDFEFRWTQFALLTYAGTQGISLFDAIEKDLGLKLEIQKVPRPVVVIESVNQTPTPNAPGVVPQLAAPPPTAFEVADLKPTPPGAPSGGMRVTGNIVELHGYPVKTLITLAFDINSDDLIAGLPKALEATRYDIVGKFCVDGTDCPPMDIDLLRVLLRDLLKDRFKLAYHMEDRQIMAWVLLAQKPKLQKADPQGRSGCRESTAADLIDYKPLTTEPARHYTCRNVTMAQFTEQLPRLNQAGGIRTPVADRTGLEGTWDFTFSVGVQAPSAQATRPAQGDASEPALGLSFPDSLNKQLGLKLEQQKRAVPVLVVDHIEEKPTEN